MAAVGMPPHILALFQARPPLDYATPIRIPRAQPLSGLGGLLNAFESDPPPPIILYETPKERWSRLKKEKQNEHEKEQQKKISQFKPMEDPNAEGDPFKTLLVARINYDTTEKKLKREFEQYGPIRRIRLVHDLNGKPRGYAFIEFEDDRDMKEAYKQGDGKKIDGRRVLVDVERSRTVPGWLPRRLGGGRGPPRGSGTTSKPKGSVSSNTSENLVNSMGNSVRLSNGLAHRGSSRDRYTRSDRGSERDKYGSYGHASRFPMESKYRRDEISSREERPRIRPNRSRSRSRNRDRKRSLARDQDGGRDRSRERHRDKRRG